MRILTLKIYQSIDHGFNTKGTIPKKNKMPLVTTKKYLFYSTLQLFKKYWVDIMMSFNRLIIPLKQLSLYYLKGRKTYLKIKGS